jgi:hypothetical protein
MLLWNDPGCMNRRRGLLIDYDYAALLQKDTGQKDKFSLGHRTVSSRTYINI